VITNVVDWRMDRSVPYGDYLIESLKSRRRAKAYLNVALEDGDPRVFLLALRNVAQATGFSNVAEKSELIRELEPLPSSGSDSGPLPPGSAPGAERDNHGARGPVRGTRPNNHFGFGLTDK